MDIDRRSVATRTRLRQSLIALILQRDYRAIAHKDILAEADVSRSSFYAHYESKDDLLARSLDHFRLRVAPSPPNS